MIEWYKTAPESSSICNQNNKTKRKKAEIFSGAFIFSNGKKERTYEKEWYLVHTTNINFAT